MAVRLVLVPALAGMLLAVPALVSAQEKAKPKVVPNSAQEPLAQKLSLARGAEFLDDVNLTWTKQRKCGTCHTNYPYLVARPLLKGIPSPAMKEVRAFFEDRAANWDQAKPRWDTEVVATAATLAINDAHGTGKLHPVTRQALDRMWTLQRQDGAWDWLKCGWPPMEHDDYYGALYAALGVGLAPDNYAQAPSAQKGLEKLRAYFQKTPAPELHHQAMLLWASLKLDGLMEPKDREATIKTLLAGQHTDGGWSLASLGDYKRRNGQSNEKNGPSDGYGTGFVVYVLRQAGLPPSHPQIRKGVEWLAKNQRESGRWFTRSLNTDSYHFITNAGTAFAVMALQACQE